MKNRIERIRTRCHNTPLQSPGENKTAGNRHKYINRREGAENLKRFREIDCDIRDEKEDRVRELNRECEGER
jgi:hypothetical protein